MILYYLRVIVRRWWLVLLPMLALGVLTLRNYREPDAPWLVRPTMQVGLPPSRINQTGEYYNYDGQYVWTSSEYLTRSISDLVVTSRFAQDVARRIERTTGRVISAESVRSAVTRDYRGTLVNVVVKWRNAEEAELIANSMMDEIGQNAREYFPQLGALETAPFRRLDDGKARYDDENARNRLDIPIRAAIALLAGLGLALIAHLLDPVMRGKPEIENLGLRVLSSVPSDAFAHKETR